MSKGYVECDSCGDRIHEEEKAYNIDGDFYCEGCGRRLLDFEYLVTVDEIDCLEAETQRELVAQMMADDAEYDAYKAKMAGID